MATETIVDLGEKARGIIEELLDKKAESVISVTKEESEWKVLVEVLERRAVPDSQDLLGRYELRLDENKELLGYERVVLRRRTDLDKEKWYKEEE
ncbi:MAG: gas vesicle protein GvpO [archaeon]|nr:gas vesicle protein GvpO [archaeon]